MVEVDSGDQLGNGPVEGEAGLADVGEREQVEHHVVDVPRRAVLADLRRHFAEIAQDLVQIPDAEVEVLLEGEVEAEFGGDIEQSLIEEHRVRKQVGVVDQLLHLDEHRQDHDHHHQPRLLVQGPRQHARHVQMQQKQHHHAVRHVFLEIDQRLATGRESRPQLLGQEGPHELEVVGLVAFVLPEHVFDQKRVIALEVEDLEELLVV